MIKFVKSISTLPTFFTEEYFENLPVSDQEIEEERKHRRSLGITPPSADVADMGASSPSTKNHGGAAASHEDVSPRYTRPRVTVRLLNPEEHGVDGVELNRKEVRLARGYLNVFRILVAAHLRWQEDELGVPQDKPSRVEINQRFYELRHPSILKKRNRRLHAVIESLNLPVPLIDPSTRRFHPRIEVHVVPPS